MTIRLLVALAGTLLTQAVRADLTLAYRTETHPGSSIPPAMADAMKQQMGVSMPADSTIRIKGEKVSSSSGALVSIIDYASGRMTLVHPPTRRFATLPASEYAAQLGAAMPQEARAAMQDVKIDTKVESTGRTAEIHGIAAEETVVSMFIEMPNPAGQSGGMRIEVHTWMATAAALQSFPALREWDASKMAGNGVDLMQIMSSFFPQGSSGQKLRASMEAILKNSTGLLLKSETRIFMPMIAQMLAAQGVSGADGPVAEVVMELVNYHTDPIPDSVFQTPVGYMSAPLVDILGAVNPHKLLH
jgi:hypothetical protein